MPINSVNFSHSKYTSAPNLLSKHTKNGKGCEWANLMWVTSLTNTLQATIGIVVANPLRAFIQDFSEEGTYVQPPQDLANVELRIIYLFTEKILNRHNYQSHTIGVIRDYLQK